MSTKTRSLNLGFLPALSLVASAFTSLSKTDTRHADAGFNIMLNSNDGTDDASQAGGQSNDSTSTDTPQTGGQQDQQAGTSNAQQGNPDDNAGSEGQQDQSNDDAPQADSAKTDTSETGGQDDAGGERQTA